MFRLRTHKTVSSLVAGLVCLAAPQAPIAATLTKLPGSIAGIVRNSFGSPQAGATVQLLNHQQRAVVRAVTDDRGQFRFAELAPDLYGVRVARLPYDAAVRRDISVRPGEKTVLTISLNPLFSSIQISYPTLDNGVMTDEWKWVLRSASSTRPVFRFRPDGSPSSVAPDPAEVIVQDGKQAQRAAMFSDMRGIVRVSAGDGALPSAIGAQADMGTTFALATAFYGSSQLQVSGNLGYGAQTGSPAAAFRTTYSRSLGGANPELSLTMRQLNLSGRTVAAMTGQDVTVPALRTMSASFDDHIEIADGVTLQYGSAMDFVSFVDHLNYISPYARLTYRATEGGQLEVAFTSGDARPNLVGANGEDGDLQRGLDTLGLFPRVSMVGGQTKVQHGEEFEVGYSQKVGSRTYQVSAYHELIRNTALSLVAGNGTFIGSDVMPDLFSSNYIYNAGNFQSTGYSASVTQALGQHLNLSVILGSTGGLTTRDRELVSSSPDDLRAMIRVGRRDAVTTRISGVLPRLGTHFSASYQYTGDQRWAMAGNMYSTQALRPMPGLNIFFRQPIPGLSKRVEATAEMRNMLAQGYLPLETSDGQRMLLVETPRSIRGGLSIIF